MTKHLCRLLNALCFLLLMCGLGLTQEVPEPVTAAPKYLNVKDFGAIGDGKADDTDALRKAFDAAVDGPNRTYHVYLPAGKYRITSTLELDTKHKDLKIEGAGCRPLGAIDPTTMIVWDGPENATMLYLPSTLGLRLSDFAMDGTKKAGNIIQVNYKKGVPSAEFYIERVFLRNAHTGFRCDNVVCASDMTFVDFSFRNLTYAFHTNGGQNVNYVFIRPELAQVDVGLYMEHGGSITCNLLAGWSVGTAVKIDNGEKNTGNYFFNGFKIEPYTRNGKRTTMFDINGPSALVYVSGMNTSVIHVDKDRSNPMFKLSGSAQLMIDSSLIWSQRIADIKSTPDGPPSFIRFTGCRFGWSDPREGSITHDANSGFALVDCILGKGFIPEYRVNPASIMIDPVTGITATPKSATEITLTWNPVNEADGYVVEVSDDGVLGFEAWPDIAKLDANTTSYTVTGLTAGTTKYYRIRAAKGHITAFSRVVSATTPKP